MHVVIGTGPIGSATASSLAAAGHRVRLISRHTPPAPGSVPSGGVAGTDLVEYRSVDVADQQALKSATDDADAIYNCVNPAYHRWATDWPPLAAAMLDAAERSGAVLVTAANLYNYGPGSGVMHEDTPARSTDVKGRVRQQMWLDALARHQAGRVRVVEARASDYLGPFATANAHGGARLIEPLLAGKAVRPLGNPDVLHSWTYLPDLGRTLAALGTTPTTWGRVWHVPSPDPKTFRQLAETFAAAAGVPTPPIKPMPSWMLTAVGTVNPMLRELKGVLYQFAEPFVMDSTAATAELGLAPTDWSLIAEQTIAWWRSGQAAATAA